MGRYWPILSTSLISTLPQPGQLLVRRGAHQLSIAPALALDPLWMNHLKLPMIMAVEVILSNRQVLIASPRSLLDAGVLIRLSRVVLRPIRLNYPGATCCNKLLAHQLLDLSRALTESLVQAFPG